MTGVTNAILKKDFEYLTERVIEWRDEMRKDREDSEQRLQMLELWHATTTERWTAHADEHKKLNFKSPGVIRANLVASSIDCTFSRLPGHWLKTADCCCMTSTISG